MNGTLKPRRCPEDAWKSWLRSGLHIYGRTFSSWGMLCLVLLGGYAFFVQSSLSDIAKVPTWPLGMCLVGFLALLTTYVDREAVEGHAGFSVISTAWKKALHEDGEITRPLMRRLVVRSLIFFAVFFALLMFITALASLLPVPPPTHEAPALPMAPQAVPPLFHRVASYAGNLMFLGWMVIPGAWDHLEFHLCIKGVPSDVARALSVQARLLNRRSVTFLHFVSFMVAWGGSVAFPVALPVLLFIHIVVSDQAYHDIFDEERKVKSLQTVKKTAPAMPKAVSVSS